MGSVPRWFSGDIRSDEARNDEVEVLVVVVSGRGELTLDGPLHQLAPMVVFHLPKGTVRATGAVDGPLAYLSVHRRRSAGLQVGRHAQQR
jgi:quercetin dioxygenase-like cupin family protein